MKRNPVLVGLAVLAGLAPSALAAEPAAAAPVPSCAATPATGGDWPSYGGTVDNARNQTGEIKINFGNAANLTLAWKYQTSDGGTFQSTPVEQDGCVFMGTKTGNVVAINADSGKQVWSTSVGYNIVGSPAVTDGLVIVGQDKNGAPFDAALDEATGRIVWKSTVTNWPNDSLEAAPVPFKGMIFQGFEGDETGDHARGGYGIIDVKSGKLLHTGYTISDSEYAAGYRGASISDTAAADASTGYLYAATGNPASAPQQAPESNAIVKIDMDPKRPTFGQIVGVASGTPEQYAVDQTPPSCVNSLPYPANRVECDQLDYDFLASPELYGGAPGQTIIGDMQKSGVYHAFDAGTMAQVWSQVLGAPCLACNLGTDATDAKTVFVSTTDGNLYALDKATGAIKWAAAGSGVVHYSALTTADGVLYSSNELGALQAYDTATGQPLLAHPYAPDEATYAYDGGNSDGISVARDTVYVAHASFIDAYRLP